MNRRGAEDAEGEPRWCRTLSALVMLPLLACGATAAPVTAVEMPSAARHPDGVLLDPPAALPVVNERAPARGVVALREPVADEALREVVRAYFQAFTKEDIDGLVRLLANDATQLDARGRGSAATLVELWRARMRSFDYTKLAGTELFRPEHVERFEFDELGARGERPRPAEMHPGDILARVPVTTPRVGTDRLFGDVIVFLLRRDEGHFKIAGFSEEDAP